MCHGIEQDRLGRRGARIDAEDQRKPRLIRASHPNHARRHIERTAVAGLDVRIATQEDLERAIVDQTPVEESKAQREIQT